MMAIDHEKDAPSRKAWPISVSRDDQSIAPGLIRTGAYGDHADHIEAALASNIPHPKRMGHADDYAKLAIAIAENDYLNGEVIRLDGGLRFPPK